MPPENAEPEKPSSEQQAYLQEFLQLKIDACYIRDYRNGFNRWITAAATIRAIASSGSIALWAIWQKHAMVWGSIIAASQIADALKDAFPFAKRRRALSAWVRQLDRLFVFAQRDWENIVGGRCTNSQIRKLLHQLRSRTQRLEAKFVPDGLPRDHELFRRAEEEAFLFFSRYYNLHEAKGDLSVHQSDQHSPRKLDT